VGIITTVEKICVVDILKRWLSIDGSSTTEVVHYSSILDLVKPLRFINSFLAVTLQGKGESKVAFRVAI